MTGVTLNLTDDEVQILKGLLEYELNHSDFDDAGVTDGMLAQAVSDLHQYLHPTYPWCEVSLKTLGTSIPFAETTPLAPMHGPSDFGDPVALRLSDGWTISLHTDGSKVFTHNEGGAISYDQIDWEATE